MHLSASTSASSLWRRPSGAVAAVAAGAVLLLGACGGDDEPEASGTTTSAATSAPSETTDTSETTDAGTTADTSQTETTPTEPVTPVEPSSEPTATIDAAVEVTIAGNQVTSSEDTLQVSPGDTVEIRITSDVDDEVHVHGVDATQALTAGQTATLIFEVPLILDPGVYEVETHDSGLLLLQLEVR
jgi:plastocyanin